MNNPYMIGIIVTLFCLLWGIALIKHASTCRYMKDGYICLVPAFMLSLMLAIIIDKTIGGTITQSWWQPTMVLAVGTALMLELFVLIGSRIAPKVKLFSVLSWLFRR